MSIEVVQGSYRDILWSSETAMFLEAMEPYQCNCDDSGDKDESEIID